jgi:hypothetical protein
MEQMTLNHHSKKLTLMPIGRIFMSRKIKNDHVENSDVSVLK